MIKKSGEFARKGVMVMLGNQSCQLERRGYA